MQSFACEQYGPWALVTGASSGIGEEFARQLAANGLNVVLVSRTKRALDNVAEKLKRDYRIKTITVAVDLGAIDAIDHIVEATEGIDVGLLVNNAAMMLAGSLLKTDISDEMQVIQVNIVANIKLTQWFTRKMSQRGRGGIIFVAGMGGYSSMPYMANYMASKAYLISFAEALNFELKNKGIDVTVLCPGITRTGAELRTKGLESANLSERIARRGMDTTPVVTAALKNLGRKPAIIPGRMNSIVSFILTKFFPRTLVRNLFAKMISKDVLEKDL